jgi:hypothetical protein
MRWEGVQLLLKSKLEVAVSYSCQLQLSVTAVSDRRVKTSLHAVQLACREVLTHSQ